MNDQGSMGREQVRRFDQDAMRLTGITSLVLMENAGRQCADVLDDLSDLHGCGVAILAGGGNNGGDGFVMARHLLLRGYEVVVFLLAAAEKYTGDALANLEILRRTTARIEDMSEAGEGELYRRWRYFDVLVDAIGGTGIAGPLRGTMAEAVRAANRTERPILAVDIPTGLDCDSGRAGPDTIRAIATVTFVAMKIGFVHDWAREWIGDLYVADIGLSPRMIAGL